MICIFLIRIFRYFFGVGPTGIGKTSSLYSALNKLNIDDVNIITTISEVISVTVKKLRRII